MPHQAPITLTIELDTATGDYEMVIRTADKSSQDISTTQVGQSLLQIALQLTEPSPNQTALRPSELGDLSVGQNPPGMH